jgi:hypothetical protein
MCGVCQRFKLQAESGELAGVHTGYNHNRFTACATTSEAAVELLEQSEALM